MAGHVTPFACTKLPYRQENHGSGPSKVGQLLFGGWNPVFPAKWDRADGHLVEFESSPQASDGDVLCGCSRRERALGRQLTG